MEVEKEWGGKEGWEREKRKSEKEGRGGGREKGRRNVIESK